MKVKKAYTKPHIEEFFIDQVVNLWEGSKPGPGFPAAREHTEPSLKSAPKYDNPPVQDYPFGGDGPDYSNM
ncbi:MAG: hypothetical protein N4A71_19480 [Carboxylicivirga sp.]|jgi:hypothetical protein|nr:hypothetical protein [Carboxylicivirga sp.]